LNSRLRMMGRRMAATSSELWLRCSPDIRLRATTSRPVPAQMIAVL
jgi:hypothetical protein